MVDENGNKSLRSYIQWHNKKSLNIDHNKSAAFLICNLAKT